MSSYIIRRFAQSFLTVLIILFTMWSVTTYLGGPARVYARTSAQVAELTKAMDELPIEQRADTGSRYNRMRVEKEQDEIFKR
ncbi:MAG TPA: hypothetical protein VND68_00020, partial [Chloroflexia bacterium]|nr:hypothetical protein [Chloroflexia bacterium]